MFKSHYGSRQGFILAKWYHLLYHMGRFHKYDVQWAEVDRFVFVCTGNICRSAFAEVVAKSLNVNTMSVGINAIMDAPANADAIKTAQAMGYDLSKHRTTPIMYPILRKTDLLIAMEPWQADLIANNLSRKYQTTLLGVCGEVVRPLINDPYNHSSEYFQNCFEYIEKTVSEISKKI